jgi:hypothetical protein
VKNSIFVCFVSISDIIFAHRLFSLFPLPASPSGLPGLARTLAAQEAKTGGDSRPAAMLRRRLVQSAAACAVLARQIGQEAGAALAPAPL